MYRKNEDLYKKNKAKRGQIQYEREMVQIPRSFNMERQEKATRTKHDFKPRLYPTTRFKG